MDAELKSVRDDLKHFISLSDDQWSLNEKFGSTNGFHQLLPVVREARSLCESLLNYDLSRAPVLYIEQVSDLLTKLLGLYARIQNVSPSSIQHNRQPLIDEFSNFSGRFIKEAMVLSAYLGTTVGAEVASRLSELQQVEQDSKDVLFELRKAAGKEGVASNGTVFEDEAKKHFRAGIYWLIVITACVGSILGLGLCHFSKVIEPPLWVVERQLHHVYLIQTLFAKILIVMAFSYFLVLSFKSYIGHRHNYVINRQKATVMRTFSLFMNAVADDPDARIRVLMQACDSIFGERSSGFSGKDASVEIGRSIVDLTSVARSK